LNVFFEIIGRNAVRARLGEVRVIVQPIEKINKIVAR
jgi:hypothetical protein